MHLACLYALLLFRGSFKRASSGMITFGSYIVQREPRDAPTASRNFKMDVVAESQRLTRNRIILAS